MANLKKRLLSFISAIALAATTISATTFSSAAAASVDVLNGGQYQNSGWGEKSYSFSVSDAGTYQLEVGYAGGGNSWFKIGVNGNYLGGNLSEGRWTTNWYNSSTKSTNVTLNKGTNTVNLCVQDGKFTKVLFKSVGGSSETEKTNTLTLNASEYSDIKYSDNGINTAIPFMVNDTSKNINVKVNYSGQGWVNTFTPNGASISGMSGPEGKTDAFSETTQKFYVQQNGSYTFTINQGSATGKYYVGVTNQPIESLEITYVDKAVSKVDSYVEESSSQQPDSSSQMEESSSEQSDSSSQQSDSSSQMETVGIYEIVAPYKSGASVSKNGNNLTAKVSKTRDYKFVGWYSDKECTNLISSSNTYTLGSKNVYAKFDFVSYNMPVISVVTSKNNGSYKEAFPDNCSKETKYSDSEVIIANSDYKLDSDMKVTLKGRGNSTWNLEKRPFQLKFDEKVNLFNNGQAKNKKWVLLANHIDRTLLRNNITLDVARTALTAIPFVSSTQPAEFYLNGEYMGVYLVVEQSEANKGRAKATEPEVPTTNLDEFGFLAEWDDLADPNEDYVFTDDVLGQKFTVKAGFVDDDNLKDQNYNTCIKAVKSYIESVSRAIKGGNESAIENLVDIDSAVDMFILQEFSKNADVGGSSFYMSKEKGEKLVFNPPWDFDRAFGNDARCKDPNGLYIDSGDSNVNDWFKWLYNNSWFKNKVSERWNELRKNAATDPKALALNTISQYTSKYSQSIDRQFNKWNSILTKTYSWYGGGYEQYYADMGTALGSNYNDQVSSLRSWIINRVSYLDGKFKLSSGGGSTTEKTLTLNASDYSDTTYSDNGSNIAIPVKVNNTANDITVTMNYSGRGWVNVFTPDSSYLNGFMGSKETSDFGGSSKTYYFETDGSYTFTIPAGSPTGIYYAGVTNQEIESIIVSYANDGDVSKVTASQGGSGEQGGTGVTTTTEVYGITNGSLNSSIKYFSCSNYNVRVDGDFINNANGYCGYLKLGLPITIDNVSDKATYTIKIYARGQNSPNVGVYDSNGNAIKSKSISDQNWGSLKSSPTTITVKGSEFGKVGTYYAGISANEYINLYKIIVEKTVIS